MPKGKEQVGAEAPFRVKVTGASHPRPASRAHLALTAAVLQCIETDVEPDTIRRFVNEELPASASSETGGAGESGTEEDRKHIDCLRKTGDAQVRSGDGFAVLAGEENLRLADRLEADWFPEATSPQQSVPDSGEGESRESLREKLLGEAGLGAGTEALLAGLPDLDKSMESTWVTASVAFEEAVIAAFNTLDDPPGEVPGNCICTDADDPNDHRKDCPCWGPEQPKGEGR